MKRILPLLTALLFAACGSNNNASVSKEELTFPFGNRLPSPPFTGEAYLQPMIQRDTVFNFPATNNITFAPGAHSTWHRHGGMVVLVTGGVGLYQEEGKPAQILRKGDVLQIPAGVRHWHGATKDNWFSQIVIYDAAWRSETMADEDTTLSDEAYDKAELVEFAHTPGLDGMMFAAPAEPLSLPTFNGPIHLANTLDAPNVADCPGLHNVVFEPGVYNAWHCHARGGNPIVKEGIGSH